jgi:flagellar M-ring protein FliF
MVPDLKPADVTVFDLVNGVSHTGESADDPFDSRLVHRIREFQRQYQDQILQDLSYIPDVGVTVNVDVDNLKSSVIRNQVVDPKKIAALYTTESSVTDAQQQRTPRGEAGQVANRPGSVAAQSGSDRTRTLTETDNQQVNGVSFEVAEKELIAAMPKAVQVSVAIPRDYYRSVAAQRKAAGEQDPAQLDVAAIEKDVLARVTKSVKALIPADSPPTAVIVNSIDRVTTPLVDTALPWSERAFEMVREWGGTGVLVLFAAMALVMLKQTVPPLPATPPVELGPLALKSAVAAESDAEESSPKPATRRDRLQSLVRDNPEATAAIIQKWIAAAK